MIVTVTPNPSIDRTLEVAVLNVGEVHRAQAVRVEAGGKGVNIAAARTVTAEQCRIAVGDAIAQSADGATARRVLEERLPLPV